MKFYTRKRRMPQVIIVSLIDIFAILLIFVIVSTTFKKEQPPAVTITLPDSKYAVAAEQGEPPVILSISEKEEIFLDAKPMTVEELLPAIKDMVNRNTRQKLALKADEKAPFGAVIRVIDVLREAGIKGKFDSLMKSHQPQ